MINKTKIVDACIQQGLCDQQQYERSKKNSRRSRQDILMTLAFTLRMPIRSFYQAYAEIHNYEFRTLSQLQVCQDMLRRFPRGLLERKSVLPVKLKNDPDTTIHLVTSDPENQVSLMQAKKITGVASKVFMSDPQALTGAVEYYAEAVLPEVFEIAAFDPVEELNFIIEQAYLSRSSDIHILPLKERVMVRLRIDGVLQDYARTFSISQGLGLMSRLKVLAGMDIAEQRMAQDGTANYLINEDVEIDMRVATMPTRFGERATLRILGSDSEALTLSQIGMSQADLAKFTGVITKPHGMILITGPTGSGKSTTLYSTLQSIASQDTNIMTVEDPVEYVMEGMSQVQVSNKVSFSSALRGFLRHDPDIIMVGEIRDGETANTAMKAAMTGHLVFSTLHTNSAIAAIPRLKDLGSEAYLIGATLLAVISQRLVKRLCNACKVKRKLSVEEAQILGLSADTHVHDACGCARCLGTGYQGRVALFETLWIDEALASMICQDADEITLREHAQSLNTLAEDGVHKLLEGVTTIDELNRLGLLMSLSSLPADNSPELGVVQQ
jgi:type IV pilus assembly protein PilB